MIYQHRATVTTAAGTVASATLKVKSGVLRQLLIRANTDTTVFRANLVDTNSLTIGNWGYREGELNDLTSPIPLYDAVTLNITNASPNDTFSILLSAEEV